ncbi:MAG: hypothetical protein J6Y94_06075 [Bacteriovoracaceae bacterium]|nr:hypothetical protein [Bacteriovoracaceae bacterium]
MATLKRIGRGYVWAAGMLGISILLLPGQGFSAMKVPTVTDNEGMTKYERINKVEKDTIEFAKDFNQLESAINQRLQSLQEQDTQLMKEVQQVQSDLAALERKMEQRLQELKNALPPLPPPTPTRVPTANL